jgi:hypothetical protein
MESGKTIALAGIIATAVVGIAGAGSSWLISRDDRSNQRDLAHEELVYDRRADVYVDALALLLRMDRALREGRSIEKVASPKEMNLLEARFRAYGSDDAWNAFIGAAEAAGRASEASASDEASDSEKAKAKERSDGAGENFSTIVQNEVR